MRAEIVFDFSKFIDYLWLQGPTGIARVDLAYADFLVGRPDLFAAGLHRRFGIATRFSHRTLARLSRLLHAEWNRGEDARVGEAVRGWLANPDGRRRISGKASETAAPWRKAGVLSVNWPYHNAFARIPRGAVYLNTSYANLNRPGYLDWLARRRDVFPVFMVHDLIPFEHPEWFWEGIEVNFRRQMEAILQHARLVITPSEATRQAFLTFAGGRGRPGQDVICLPMPPAGEFLEPAHPWRGAAAKFPYFVVCATIEPRKNHNLLFDVWSMLAREQPETAPRLLVVGGRGWRNEAILQRLEREESLKGLVLEVSNLPTPCLRDLVAGAAGLLMPSLAEGYGMPLVEGLSQGVPVLASDIPVFREVSRGAAAFLPPEDAAAWRDAIVALCAPETARQARARAATYQPITWDSYFERLMREIDQRLAAQGASHGR